MSKKSNEGREQQTYTNSKGETVVIQTRNEPGGNVTNIARLPEGSDTDVVQLGDVEGGIEL